MEVAVRGDGEGFGVWCGFGSALGGLAFGHQLREARVDAVFGDDLGYGIGWQRDRQVRVLGFRDAEWGDRCSGFDSGDLLALLVLLHDAEFVFHLQAELVGGAAELAHQLAEPAGEFGQFLGAEEDKGDNEDDCAVGKAGHVLCL